MIGLVAAIAYRVERDELRRECPNCGRVTKIYDALCTRCGAELEFPEVAIAPESWEQRPRSERLRAPRSSAQLPAAPLGSPNGGGVYKSVDGRRGAARRRCTPA